MSVGVKGFRVGTGPRGHYIQAGLGGFSYRTSFRSSGACKTVDVRNVPDQVGDFPIERDVKMIEVESGDLEVMRDESFNDLLKEINAKQQQASMARLLGSSTIAISVMAI